MENQQIRKHVKRLFRHCVSIMVMLMVFLCQAAVTWSAITIEDVSPVDVTPSGFAMIWQTSEPALPGISIFSDPDGTTDITSQLEIIPFPLYGGNPRITGEYEREADMENIRSRAMSYGIMKIRVEGCLPETTYYYRISAEGADGGIATWPAGPLPSVTTPRENSFIADSKQILLVLDDQGGTVDLTGWLVSGAEVPAVSGEVLFGASSFVGDGAEANQAYINLGNLFGPDGLNWTPTGQKEITLKVRKGLGTATATAYKTITLDFSNNFFVSTVYLIQAEQDIDNDGIPDPWEMTHFEDLTTADETTDYDHDGLLDKFEYLYNTDPKNPDSDGDGMPDGYEVANRLDPLDNGSTDPDNGPDGDPDNDGHTNTDEYLAGSGAQDSDSFPVDIAIALHKGLNIFGYPVTESAGLTSFGLLALLGDSTEIGNILVYDQTNNTYKKTYYNGSDPAGDNVVIGFGDAIMVYSLAQKTVSFNPAIRPFNSYINCTPVDLAAGLNVTTFPCVPSGYTSYQMLADVGGETFISSIQRFNPDKGGFETAGYLNGLIVGEDSLIRAGEGYIINMRQGVSGFRP